MCQDFGDIEGIPTPDELAQLVKTATNKARENRDEKLRKRRAKIDGEVETALTVTLPCRIEKAISDNQSNVTVHTITSEDVGDFTGAIDPQKMLTTNGLIRDSAGWRIYHLLHEARLDPFVKAGVIKIPVPPRAPSDP